jgi:NodT family efflux transporter outer membrane factor (OMF) lipoprotein
MKHCLSKNSLKILAAFAAALLLTACVDTPPTEPQVAEIAPESLGLSGAPMPAVPDNWWKGFNDPQIDRLAAAMLRGNPTLTAALARIRAAQAELSSEQAADKPQVTLDGSEQRTLFSKDYIIPPPYGGSWRWFGQLTTNFTWNLDFWGKQAALIEKARDTAQASAYDAAAARLALSGALAQTYINLMLSYQNGDIADATLAEREAILKLTQGRYESGLENAAALEQARTLVAEAKIDQMRFAAQREMDVHAIAALIGEGAAAYPTIVRPTPALDAALPLPEALPADLLARRPDILAARARVAAAAKGREAAHAEFYPDINLTAMIGFQAIGLSNLISGDAFTTGIGPAIHLPIFDAGKIRAGYAGATAGLDVAVADYNGAVVNAIRQTADAMTQVASLEARRGEARDALDSATRAFDLAQDRYRLGLANQLPMLSAEAGVLQARQQAAGIAADATAQRVTLLLAAGGAFHDTGRQADIAKQD